MNLLVEKQGTPRLVDSTERAFWSLPFCLVHIEIEPLHLQHQHMLVVATRWSK